MTPPTASARSIDMPAPAADLLDAASQIVAEKGLGGLTLRPLAQRLGTSVSAITHRFGQKGEVLTAVCAAAAAAEAATFAGWRRRFDGLGALPADAVAAIADAILDDLLHAGRQSTQIYCELVQAAAWQPELRASLTPWLAQRSAFWMLVAGLADAPPPFDLGAALHAYATDELAHGLALNDDPAYRWLRRLGVGRLCAGLLPGDRRWDAGAFDSVHAELGAGIAQIDRGARYRVEKRSEMLAEIGREIADLILHGGSEAVTHRSVGQRAGMPATTLVYHFPRQTDLLKAGLESIIDSVQASVDGEARVNRDVESDGGDIAVSTFAIALAATRFPELRPFEADMRRRRGENGYIHLRRLSADPDRIDMLAAQALSVTLIGDVLLRRAGGLVGASILAREMTESCLK
jgi:AcrR family transcriptional regulator